MDTYVAAQQSAPMKAQESNAFMNQVADYILMFPYQGTYMCTVTTEPPPLTWISHKTSA